MTTDFFPKITLTKSITSTYKGNRVVVGEYDLETRVFHKRVKPSDLLKALNAYGMDCPAVEQLIDLKCLQIRLHVIKEGTFCIDFEDFRKLARKIDWPARGRSDFPARLYVPLKYWKLDTSRDLLDAKRPTEFMPQMDYQLLDGFCIEGSVMENGFSGNCLPALNMLAEGWKKRAFAYEMIFAGFGSNLRNSLLIHVNAPLDSQEFEIGGPGKGYVNHFRAMLTCENCNHRFEGEIPFSGVCPKCEASIDRICVVSMEDLMIKGTGFIEDGTGSLVEGEKDLIVIATPSTSRPGSFDVLPVHYRKPVDTPSQTELPADRESYLCTQVIPVLFTESPGKPAFEVCEEIALTLKRDFFYSPTPFNEERARNLQSQLHHFLAESDAA